MRCDYLPLDSFARVKGGKRLPPNSQLTQIPTQHPYIRVRDLGNCKTLELNADYQYIDDTTQSIISRYTVSENDIIISIVGTIGLIAKIGRTLDGANLTENCAKIIELKNLNADFLYYYLTSVLGQSEIAAATVGAVQAKLPLKNILTLQIPNLPFPEQKAIAAVLSALDAKIELNNRINKNLEAQAQAIFKSWFVDFEPFRDGEIVDSELGPIPKGWKVGVLSELIKVRYGKDHKKLETGKIPTYGSGGIMRYVDKALYEKESVLIPRKGTLNNIIYINEPFWTVDTMFYSEMRSPNVAKYVFFILKLKDLASMNAGTAVPSMTTDILNNIPIIIPPEILLLEYNQIVSPMFQALKANNTQSQKLAALRDTLLPKLMSGEIRVPLEV